ncbi:hypothetical protein [Methylorubrum sp. Q1]|uniref:hypothetical protein n=1 Tax=Methylorubrum sp. Q1 TaxID=2562453 RepID=UPI001FE1BFF5|nr:hypothetical protein [Methylorubrum sp. Q1]
MPGRVASTTVAPRSTIGLSKATPRTSSRFDRSIAIADTTSLFDERMLLTVGGRWQSLDVNSYNPVTGFRSGASESGAFSPGIGLSPGLSLTGRVIYTAAQYCDLANSQKIPDRATLDLGLRYATLFRDRPLTRRANVVNVTGHNDWATTGRGILAQGTPRTVLLSASVDF